jgi:hypothetical protein
MTDDFSFSDFQIFRFSDFLEGVCRVGPGARQWSGFARAVEAGIRRSGPELAQSRHRWAAAGKFRGVDGRLMAEKSPRRRALRGAVGGGGRAVCARGIFDTGIVKPRPMMQLR